MSSNCSQSDQVGRLRRGYGRYFPSFRFYLHCHMLLLISFILVIIFPPSILADNSLPAILIEFVSFVSLGCMVLSAPIVPFVGIAILLLAAWKESRPLAAIGALDLAVSVAQWLALYPFYT